MAGDYLLDTNIVSAILDRDPALLGRQPAGRLFVPITVAGELYYGAEHSQRRVENLQRIESYIASSLILDGDLNTARAYGRIKGQLRAKGKKIPDNDIWIAAFALQFDLTLATRDGHFDYVDGLRVEAW